jgi:hypothetical protein
MRTSSEKPLKFLSASDLISDDMVLREGVG